MEDGTGVEKAGDAADAGVRARLELKLNHVDVVQLDADRAIVGGETAETLAAKQMFNDARARRKFLELITLGQLAGADGKLGNVARLAAWLGSHVRAQTDAGAA